MANSIESKSLVETKEKKSKVKHKFRDTTLVRVQSGLKEEVKGYAKRTHQTISKVMDFALQEYLDSVRELN